MPDSILPSHAPSEKPDARGHETHQNTADQAVNRFADEVRQLVGNNIKNEDKLQIIDRLAHAGVKQLQLQEQDGTTREFTVREANLGHGRMIHLFANGSDGKEHVVLRGYLTDDGQLRREHDDHGQFVNFEGDWWSKHMGINAPAANDKTHEQNRPQTRTEEPGKEQKAPEAPAPAKPNPPEQAAAPLTPIPPEQATPPARTAPPEQSVVPARPTAPIAESRAAAAPAEALDTNFPRIHAKNVQLAHQGADFAVYGDSIVQALGNHARENNGIFGGRVAALGVTDDGAYQLRTRLDNGEAAFPKGGQPRVAAIMIGTNDLRHGGADDVASDVVNAATRAHERLPGTKILIEGILPRGNQYLHGQSAAGMNEMIAGVNERIRSWVEQHRQEGYFYGDVGRSFLRSDHTVPDYYMQRDGLHLSLKGMALLQQGLSRSMRAVDAGR